MKTFLETLSILETEFKGSSGSFIALVMHLKRKRNLNIVISMFFETVTFYTYKHLPHLKESGDIHWVSHS